MVLSPDILATCIYGSFFMASTSALAILAYLGHDISASAITALTNPPDITLATAIANTSPGNARNISDSLIIMLSIIPP